MEKTLENLAKGFVGESQARNRYTMYANKARSEGFIQISNVFLETAEQEKEHAEWFWKMFLEVKGNPALTMEQPIFVETDVYPKLGNTMDNLNYAITGETHEYTSLYEKFVEDAIGEGFPRIAARIKAIAIAERHHAERFTKLYKQLTAQTHRNKVEDVSWVCTKCGYEHNGKYPPDECPSCGHEEGFFIIKCETY